MFTPTIFSPEINPKIERLILEDSKIHHLRKVLRMKDFDSIKISNGTGQLFFGHLLKNSVEINSQKYYQRNGEITIFVPYLREKNRFRFMIEKLVELNVYRIFLSLIHI